MQKKQTKAYQAPCLHTVVVRAEVGTQISRYNQENQDQANFDMMFCGEDIGGENANYTGGNFGTTISEGTWLQ